MKTSLKFELTREAKSKGGDRYEATPDGEDRPMVIYIPQAISRGGDSAMAPCTVINVTIEPV